MKTYGKTTWLIPDCYLEPVSNGQISHEAICVLNTSPEEAAIELTLFFEDRKTDTAFRSSCPSMRTHHIRLDRLISEDGREIPHWRGALRRPRRVECPCRRAVLET